MEGINKKDFATIKSHNSKNYCILTLQVSNLGGAQLYTLRRANYLISKGYNVKIIACIHDNFILENEFKNIPLLIIPEFTKPVFSIKKTKRDYLLKKTSEFAAKQGKGTIIESHTLFTSVWGELLADSLKGKHITYLLNENKIDNFPFSHIQDFFQWKFKRGELIGVSDVSLSIIFGDLYDPKLNNFVNVPFDEKELNEKTKPDFLNQIPDNSFVIGTISRLSKGYIDNLIISTIKLSDEFKEIHFCLIIGGDDPEKHILENLKNKYISKDNFSVLFTGYIKQLGRDIFKRIDIFVGMGTAAVNSISQKCATITIDPRTNLASGIFGINSFNFAYSENVKTSPIDAIIRKMINNQNLLQDAQIAGYKLFKKEYSLSICMQKFDNFISSSNQDKVYWCFHHYYTKSLRLRLIYVITNTKFSTFLLSFYKFFKLRLTST